MEEIRSDLIPHRDEEAEEQLKALIQEIEELMEDPKNEKTVRYFKRRFYGVS